MSIQMEDRISNLPDSLICHILSFLSTKLAVTTSILSKRWTPLWRSVLALNFDEKPFKNFSTFRNFVGFVIKSREDTLPLLSFRITCYHSLPFYDTLTPRVFSLLTCKTLVVLKLNNLIIPEVPQLVDLRSLKTLSLVSVLLGKDYLDFRRLLYGCPILENLQTNALTSLYLHCCNSDSEGDYKVLPKLVRANLSDFRWESRFALFHNVKFLRMELRWTDGYQVPTFHNLTNLELIFKTSFSSWFDKWKWVIQVLQHCPKLQDLNIDEASNDMSKYVDWVDLEYQKIVPECLSSQFRTCTLKGLGYNDIERELQFAKYIMLNSKILCTMTIKSCSLVSKREKDQMLVRLSSYLSGSPTCKLLVD